MEAKVIEQNDEFTIVETRFKGEVLNIRYCSDGVAEFRFNDAFCRTFGCKNREDFLKKNPRAKTQMVQYLGGIPDWVMMQPDGKIAISKFLERPQGEAN